VITHSDFPTDRKRALISKLDELMSEVANRRVNFAKVMFSMWPILVGATAVLADSPNAAATINNAVTSIIRLIDHDKRTEDAANTRLAPPAPPKALPGPSAAPRSRNTQQEPLFQSPSGLAGPPDSDLDDDIPF
jgi:hypothetical protein